MYDKQVKTTQIGRQGQATNAPHSEIKMKEEGKGDSNQIKYKNEAEVNRHREKHREGLAAQK